MRKISFHDQISKNIKYSVFLVIIIFSILMILVYFISLMFIPEMSIIIMIMAFIMMILYTYSSYMYGEQIILRVTAAKPADPNRHVYLINVVEGLSIAAGIPTPKVYLIESDEMNAFATGRDPQHSSIVVTTGLLKNLKRDELEGVIGHEISHIANYDIRFATLVAVLVGMIAIVSDALLRLCWYSPKSRDKEKKIGLLIPISILLAIFAPIFVRLVQLAISRRREFLADANSAKLTRYPIGLANALEKIMKFNKGNMKISEAVSHLFFVDPNKSPLDRLYATHLDIRERIRILRSM